MDKDKMAPIMEAFEAALNSMTLAFTEDVRKFGVAGATIRFERALVEHRQRVEKQIKTDPNAEEAYKVWWAAASLVSCFIVMGVWRD
jgi:hypothetical protein